MSLRPPRGLQPRRELVGHDDLDDVGLAASGAGGAVVFDAVAAELGRQVGPAADGVTGSAADGTRQARRQMAFDLQHAAAELSHRHRRAPCRDDREVERDDERGVAVAVECD